VVAVHLQVSQKICQQDFQEEEQVDSMLYTAKGSSFVLQVYI
jgi:hypothetical protein